MKARLLLYMAPLLTVRIAAAGPWNIEPRLGLSVDYETNPVLHQFDTQPEEHVAALVYLPLRYDSDAVEFSLIPNARLSNSQGYSTLAGNFVHIDANAVIADDRGSTSLQAGTARDSSLYYVGAFINGVGVRRDTDTAAADWTHSLTERAQIQVDASWVRVRYGQPIDVNFLVDYRYPNAGPTFSYMVDERDTATMSVGAGLYESLNGLTSSRSRNAQVGWTRQLTELWSLSTSAGYSKSANSEKVFFGPFFLGDFTSSQNGTVFSATATYKGERLSFNAGASRALQPTGFAYLSRQDSVTLSSTYARNERLDFSLTGSFQKSRNPLVNSGGTQQGSEVTVRYFSAQLTANWHWTERWTISLHATRIVEGLNPPASSGASTGASIDITRQFLRTEF